MKNIKVILILGFAFSFYFQLEAQDAKIRISKSQIGTGVTVFNDINYRIVGSISQSMHQNFGHLTHEQLWYLPVEIIAIDVEKKEGTIPIEFSLEQNYPNPFNPTTTIQFTLPEVSWVSLKLFDILGKELTTVVDTEMEKGVHKVLFDGKKFASGVYFYRIEVSVLNSDLKKVLVQSRKLMFLK